MDKVSLPNDDTYDKVRSRQEDSNEENSADPIQNSNASPTSSEKEVAGYRIQEKLGSGSYGTVFKAEKVVKGVLYTRAIKVMTNHDDPRESKYVLSEISILKGLKPQHKNIVCVHDVQEDKKNLYLVLEFCEGGDLGRLIRTRRSGRLSEHLIKRLMGDLSAGLEFLHGEEILHRDIKPQNLLLTGPLPLVLGGEELGDAAESDDEEKKRQEANFPENCFLLKIADFGFSRTIGNSGAMSGCGTNGYRAPELMLGHRYHYEADIYSTGKVLLDMITGTPSLEAPVEDELPKILDQNSMTRRCLPLLELCLKKFPKDRSPEKFFKACDEFVNAEAGCRQRRPMVNIFTDVDHKSSSRGKISERQDDSDLKNDYQSTINYSQPINKPKDSPYSKVYIESKLAMEFGNGKGHSEWVIELDKRLKVQSFSAIKAIKEGGRYDWESMVSAMNGSEMLVKVPGSEKHKSDEWKTEEMNYFKIDGSPDDAKVKQILTWFKKCICDVDASIYENSTLVREGVVERLAEIASETGARIDSFETFIAKKQSRSEKVLEMCLVRFPDKENPHVKLCCIRIFSWYKSGRLLVIQKDRAGFKFECKIVEFKLVDGLTEKITDGQLEKIAAKLNVSSTFDDF